jgi:hypothetical protein
MNDEIYIISDFLKLIPFLRLFKIKILSLIHQQLDKMEFSLCNIGFYGIKLARDKSRKLKYGEGFSL